MAFLKTGSTIVILKYHESLINQSILFEGHGRMTFSPKWDLVLPLMNFFCLRSIVFWVSTSFAVNFWQRKMENWQRKKGLTEKIGIWQRKLGLTEKIGIDREKWDWQRKKGKSQFSLSTLGFISIKYEVDGPFKSRRSCSKLTGHSTESGRSGWIEG